MSSVFFRRTPVCAAIALSIAPVAAVALEANPVSEPRVEKVYVSGTRTESVLLPLATSITLIDAEQIRLSGATQVSEVLRTQAGIQLQDLDGSGGRNVTIAMRGFGSNAANNTLILVDGRKLNNPSLAGPALNTIALKDVERIEILQGSAGVLYGDQAVGGVINIVTRRAQAGETSGWLQAQTGSDNLENYTAGVAQGFTNGVSYTLSAQKRNADNYRDNNQAAYENLLANLRYDFIEGYLFVEGQTVDDQLRLPGAITDAQAAQNPRQTNNPTHYANQETQLWRLGGGVVLTEAWQFLAEYADRDERSLSFYGFGTPTVQTMRVKNMTPRFHGRLPTTQGEALLTLGYDKVIAEYLVPDWATDVAQDIDGLYGQLIYPFDQSLAITVGARHSRVQDRNNQTLHQQHEDSLNAFELGLNYQLDRGWRLFTRYAEGFRFANADENALVLPQVDFLAAQTSQAYEGGAAWEITGFETKLTVYHMAIKDEIIYDPLITNPASWNGMGANINLPDSRRRGLLADANLSINPQVSLRVNYTYTDAELTSGTFAGNQVPWVAKHTGALALVFTPQDDWTIYFDALFTGARYRVGDNENTRSQSPSVAVSNFHVLWSPNNLEIGARIKNLGDKRYTDYQGLESQYPQPGRTYEISLGYRF